ncbi:GGDEF domain-containing protein (plasmid) [Pseudoalteromonas sp. T1lg65]|uniref:GGDEF domain-containing protein n=1 Tax=Pseudoalteromonas sp. T1lg65 TaxID=2077101 RepID=UPI003F794779
MKLFIIISVLWCLLITAAYLLLNISHDQYEIIEELTWILISVSILVLTFREVKKHFLVGAFSVYCIGLTLDLLDNFFTHINFPLLNFDTSLKNIGFLLVCMGFVYLVKSKQHTILSLNKEIEMRMALEKQMRYEANHDSMTGIGSRRACFDQLHKHQFDGYTLLYLDLDNFKQVNDKHGHLVGDKVLKTFTQNLTETFGLENCFRIGGDEFIAFSSSESLPKDQVRETLLTNIEQYGTSVSIGTVKVDPQSQPDILIHQADGNMYSDKQHKAVRTTVRSPSS